MVFKRCASEMVTNSVSTNGNWALYASKSVFDSDDKGPKPASVSRTGGTSISLPVPTPTTDVPTAPVVPDYPKEPDSSDKLSAGAIAGIVIGGVAAVGIFVVLAIWLILRHRRKTRGAAAVPGAGTGPHTPGTDAHHWEAPPVQTGSGYAPVPPNPPMSDSGNSHGWNQTGSVGGSGGTPSDYRGSVLYPPPSSPGQTNMGQYGQMPTEAYQPAETSKVGPMEGTTYVEVPGSMPPMSQYQQTTPPGMYGQPPPPPPPPASELDAQQNFRQY